MAATGDDIDIELSPRNIWCPLYDRCLDEAIRSQAQGFSCQGCEHEHDLTRRPINGDDIGDAAGPCIALLVAIFKGVSPLQAEILVRGGDDDREWVDI